MKKRPFWYIALFIIATFFLVLLFAMLLEFFKPIVSPEDFTSRMEEAGHTVEERTPPFEQIEIYLVADCGAFYVEYMVHRTMADARLTFSQLRSDLEQLEQLWDIVVHTYSSSGFNSHYEQFTSDGQVAKMTRVRNTIIFASTIDDHYGDVLDIWKMLDKCH